MIMIDKATTEYRFRKFLEMIINIASIASRSRKFRGEVLGNENQLA